MAPSADKEICQDCGDTLSFWEETEFEYIFLCRSHCAIEGFTNYTKIPKEPAQEEQPTKLEIWTNYLYSREDDLIPAEEEPTQEKPAQEEPAQEEPAELDISPEGKSKD